MPENYNGSEKDWGQQQTVAEGFVLEGVIVCDRYHDFLRHTLPHNKFLFDKLVVVTSPEDTQTRKLCEFYHVECVPTDKIRSRWKEFHKGEAINEGLNRLSKKGWVVHLDADIWLPPQTRELISRMDLDKSHIFGIDRYIVKGHDAWKEFTENPKLQHENGTWVHANTFPMGTRVMFPAGRGYIPIGFFQLWHPGVSGVKKYPEGHTTAGREDALFAFQWPRGMRGLLPEIIGYHLETEGGMGVNWGGRTSPEFK